MAKKKAAKKTAKAEAAPVGNASPDASPAPTGPTSVVDFLTGRPVHVSIHEGTTFGNGDGRLVYVKSGPSSHLMEMAEAANKFALRKADNVAIYSEKGFGSPMLDGHEPLNIATMIDG